MLPFTDWVLFVLFVRLGLLLCFLVHFSDFRSYVIKNAGTVPIKRRKDYDNQKVDNADAMGALIDTLGAGSCVW